MAAGQADINRCPPGGQEGIQRLASITGRVPIALNPAHGAEAPRSVAWIDENWCIGCTLCVKACPTDAIMGSHQRMHTVIEPYCTGCGLCLPVCPVDCIVMEPVGEATGWQAWSPAQANEARDRYAARQVRLAADEQTRAARQTSELQAKLSDLAAHSHITDADALARKQTLVAAALAKARAKRSGAL
jgi:electron transport complex protein RnfB